MSLCDRSGSWSRPYAEAGYTEVQIDLAYGQDVRLMKKLEGPVHGILIAPPCTRFARSGAVHWARKGDAEMLDGLSVVDACLRTVIIYKPEWWVLENPIGRLQDYLGPPAFKFDPCDYSDPWTKRTWLWGYFTPPVGMFCPSAKEVFPAAGDVTTKLRNFRTRSVTPPGFARAFFEANP